MRRFQPSRMAKAKDFEINYQEIQDEGFYDFSQVQNSFSSLKRKIDRAIERGFPEDSNVYFLNVDNPHVDFFRSLSQ